MKVTFLDALMPNHFRIESSTDFDIDTNEYFEDAKSFFGMIS